MQYWQAMYSIPWAILTKFHVVEGFLMFFRFVQISTLQVWNVGWSSSNSRKIANFWYKFAPKGYIPLSDFHKIWCGEAVPGPPPHTNFQHCGFKNLGFKGVLQRTFFLFQLTNDLCRRFSKIVIILFLSKAVFIKDNLVVSIFCAKIEPPQIGTIFISWVRTPLP